MRIYYKINSVKYYQKINKTTNLINDKIIEKEKEIERMKQQIRSLVESQKEIIRNALKDPEKLMQIA